MGTWLPQTPDVLLLESTIWQGMAWSARGEVSPGASDISWAGDLPFGITWPAPRRGQGLGSRNGT